MGNVHIPEAEEEMADGRTGGNLKCGRSSHRAYVRGLSTGR